MKTYETVDKSTWGDGPWQGEPDKASWTDEETGLPCLVVRGPSGALCGYVAVSEGHPWFEKPYGGGGWDDQTAPDCVIDVHGGLTFSDLGDEGRPESEGICHVPEEGQPDHVWWFGFDCAHAWDITPGSNARLREHAPHLAHPAPDEVYRDLGYVRREVERLARQLKAVADGSGS